MRTIRTAVAVLAAAGLLVIAAAPAVSAAPRPASGRHTVTVVPVYSSVKPSPADSASMLAGAKAFWAREVPGMSWTSKTLPAIRVPNPCTQPGAQKALEAAVAKSGVNVNRHGAHLVVYIPECNSGSVSAAGFGMVGAGSGWLAIYGRDLNGMTLAHEFGHNLGLEHSTAAVCHAGGVQVSLSAHCTTDEYGNAWEVMGSGDGPSDSVRLGPAWQSQLTGRTVAYTGKPVTVTLSATGSRGTQAVRIRSSFGTVYLGALPMGDRAVVEAVRVKDGGRADADRLSFPDATGTRDRSIPLVAGTGDQATALLSTGPDEVLQIGSSWTVPGTKAHVLVVQASAGAVTVTVSPRRAPASDAAAPVLSGQAALDADGATVVSWTPVAGAAVYLVSSDAGVVARAGEGATSAVLPARLRSSALTVSAVFPDGSTVVGAPTEIALP